LSEFDALLDYLESYNNKKLIPKQERKVKQEKQVAPPDVKVEDFKNIHSDVQPVFTKKKVNFVSSKSFDIDRFHKLCTDRMKQEYESYQNYERPYFSVGELVQCLRMTYFQRMKYKVDIDKMFSYGNLLLITEIGKEIHNIVQTMYDGFEETERVALDEKYKIKGRVDAITKNIIYEFKTIDDEKYKDTYEHKHLIQGCMYAYILNNNYDYKIDTITIVYFPRSLKKIFSFDIKYDESIALKYINKATLLKQAIESKIVPEECEIGTDSCTFCAYKKYCSKQNEIPIKKDNEPVFLL